MRYVNIDGNAIPLSSGGNNEQPLNSIEIVNSVSLATDPSKLYLISPQSDTNSLKTLRANTHPVSGIVTGGSFTSLWSSLAIASGGVQTDIVHNGLPYKLHSFTSSGLFEVNTQVNVDYLIIGHGGNGGDGAGGYPGGGGGAGGLIHKTNIPLPPGDYQISIHSMPPYNIEAFDNVAYKGGDGANGLTGTASSGGSGGGKSWGNNRPPGLGMQNQGHNGGGALNNNSHGGGGGAGGPGLSYDSGDPVNSIGGPGIILDITGEPVVYAKGGSGGVTVGPASDGLNPGDGGQGGAWSSGVFTGGKGRPGIVMIRYQVA